MADVILVLATIAFFVVCATYVSWCDRIIGPDPNPVSDRRPEAPESIQPAEVPA